MRQNTWNMHSLIKKALYFLANVLTINVYLLYTNYTTLLKHKAAHKNL